MSKRKADTFYWRIARNNTKMSNDIYKLMLKKSRLISSKMSLNTFKEAYHSINTPTEYRLLLLSSIYTGESLTKHTMSFLPAYEERKIIDPELIIDTIKGQKSFRLIGLKRASKSAVDIKLSNKMKNEVKFWKPWADKRQLLTKTLISGNAQKQKAALLLGELSRVLYASGDLFNTNIRANDPWNIYIIKSPIESDSEEVIEDTSQTQGDYKNNETTFYRHLLHMANEYSKYFPLLNRLGIDTLGYEAKYSELIQSVGEFIQTEYTNSREETEDLYSKVHELTKDTLHSLLNLAKEVENIDLNDQIIYRLRKLDAIPTFIDYSAQKMDKHSTAINEGAVTKIENMIRKIKK